MSRECRKDFSHFTVTLLQNTLRTHVLPSMVHIVGIFLNISLYYMAILFLFNETLIVSYRSIDQSNINDSWLMANEPMHHGRDKAPAPGPPLPHSTPFKVLDMRHESLISDWNYWGGVGMLRVRGFLVSGFWFLGFEIVWFLGFKVSKIPTKL